MVKKCKDCKFNVTVEEDDVKSMFCPYDSVLTSNNKLINVEHTDSTRACEFWVDENFLIPTEQTSDMIGTNS